MKLVSVVVPCYNEEEVLPMFYDEITKVTDSMKKEHSELEFEFLFINDGSKDRTLEIFRQLADKDKRVRYISFSRNLGKESGMYDGIRQGDFDRMLDAESNDPGRKLFEKLTAGVYLGELCRRMLRAASDEGLLGVESAEKIRELGWIDSAVIDAWSMGEDLDQVCSGEEDAAFVRTLCEAMFERSERCMCLNLAAIALLSGEEKVRICAEGSLVQKGRFYRPMLEKLIREEIEEKLGVQVQFTVGSETTLPGSAAAALLNL